MAQLKIQYNNEIAPALMKKFGYKSVMQIPKLDKVVINVGCGEARDNPKVIDAIVTDISTITGQKPVICKAKKSVANFKLPTRSTARATTPWVSESSWFSPRSTTIRSTRSEAWISAS